MAKYPLRCKHCGRKADYADVNILKARNDWCDSRRGAQHHDFMNVDEFDNSPATDHFVR
jgi:hypothetical protein